MTDVLTSIRNPAIRRVRKLQRVPRFRRETGLFVAEGVRVVEEVLQAGWVPDTVLYTESLSERGEAVLTGFMESAVEMLAVSEDVMRAVSSTKTPQGLLAVLPEPVDALPAETTFLLVLDGVRDPGNVGAILRVAAAAGVEAVLLTPGSADPFQPKAVRAGMGAHFKLPVRRLSWEEIRTAVAGKSIYLADSHAQLVYTQADLSGPLALVIGGEAHGADVDVEALHAEGLVIPMPGGMESLNAAVAAGILVFEALRQRSS